MHFRPFLKPLKLCNLKRSAQLISRQFFSPAKIAALSELGKKSIVYSENDGYVMKSPYGTVDIPAITIDQYVWKNMSKWQNHTAIECGITGRKYSFAKLRDHCAAVAIRLRKDFKLQQKDIVGICLPNVPEYAVAFLGSIEGGLIATTINPSYTSEEISRQLMSCKPKAIFCLSQNVDVVRRACTLAKQPDIKLFVVQMRPDEPIPTNTSSFMELMITQGLNLSESSELSKGIKLDDPTALLYSSGTTGLPKGVMLTHRNLVSNCQSIEVPLPYEPLIQPTTDSQQEVLPCILPFFHIYGLMVTLMPKLTAGAKLVTIPKFDVNTLLRVIREQKATFLYLVPTIVIGLNNYKNVSPADFDHVRKVMCGGSNLAETDGEQFKKIAQNAAFFQGYGMTETSPMCTLTPQGMRNYGTIGWPVPNVEMKIANLDDPTFKGLPPNQTGELLIRGPNIMKGYYQNEEATRDIMTENNWLRTGDIGNIDGNGLFYISDRLKELIKVNANQVAPAELEGILREIPDILDAVVIGIPDPKCGEVPKAFVIRKPESKVTAEDVQKFVAKQVIKYKQLTGGVQFIDSIPKSPTGKVLRREIRKSFT